MTQRKRRHRRKPVATFAPTAPVAAPQDLAAETPALLGSGVERIEAAQPAAEDQSVQDPLEDWPDSDAERGLLERPAQGVEGPER